MGIEDLFLDRKEDMFIRNAIYWELWSGDFVKMPVNPQTMAFNFNKQISPTRTKGGFNVQYWGENLLEIAISGITGLSGVEGIELLYDVYRSEQLTREGIGNIAARGADLKNFAKGNMQRGADRFETFLESDEPQGGRGLPDSSNLAVKATAVKMWYNYRVYSGWFSAFDYTENAESPGVYNYSLKYTVWNEQGRRRNWATWHRDVQGNLIF